MPSLRSLAGRLGLADTVLRSAVGRLAEQWRPMAAWSLLVWAAVSVLLAPLSSLLLSGSWLTGEAAVVGNEALVGWLATPRGVLWLLLAGTLSLVGTALHFAGISTIVRADLRGAVPPVPVIARGLALELPVVLRLCAAAVLAGLAAALPYVGGVATLRAVFLDAQDINYYLTERPAAWWWFLSCAAAWTTVWGAVVVYLAGRTLLAPPAFLHGHRSLRAAVRRSWRATRGGEGRALRTVVIALGGWLLLRGVVDALAVAGGSTVVDWVATTGDSLTPLVAAAGAWTALSLTLDATVTFVGIAFVSTVVTKLYLEATNLHVATELPSVDELSERLGEAFVRWTRPRRAVPVVGLAVLLSWSSGVLLLQRVPEPGPVDVTAHRAGPAPAPENTLAALERAIEAGAGWAEIDVQLTRDGVPVVLHDADLRRMTGDPRRVSATDYREMARLVQRPDDGSPPSERRVASLAEFLDRAEGRIGLMVELKYYGWNPELARAVVELVRERGASGRVNVISLELRGVRQVKVLAPELAVGYVVAAAAGDPVRAPGDFLALSRQTATPSVIRAARRRGKAVHVWTVNRAPAMAEVIQRGAEGLITDRPALAVRIREELNAMPAISRLFLRLGHLAAETEPGVSGAAF